MKKIIILIAAVLLAGCDSKDFGDAGETPKKPKAKVDIQGVIVEHEDFPEAPDERKLKAKEVCEIRGHLIKEWKRRDPTFKPWTKTETVDNDTISMTIERHTSYYRAKCERCGKVFKKPVSPDEVTVYWRKGDGK